MWKGFEGRTVGQFASECGWVFRFFFPLLTNPPNPKIHLAPIASVEEKGTPATEEGSFAILIAPFTPSCGCSSIPVLGSRCFHTFLSCMREDSVGFSSAKCSTSAGGPPEAEEEVFRITSDPPKERADNSTTWNMTVLLVVPRSSTVVPRFVRTVPSGPQRPEGGVYDPGPERVRCMFCAQRPVPAMVQRRVSRTRDETCAKEVTYSRVIHLTVSRD